jgi:hypothetical protein
VFGNLLKVVLKNIFYFLNFIFNIITLKISKNIKKLKKNQNI